MQFRTKARAVDLLGKGQIADLPTAITELWKNGYDAYADTIADVVIDDKKLSDIAEIKKSKMYDYILVKINSESSLVEDSN